MNAYYEEGVLLMVFSGILFITRFLPLVLAIYFVVPKKFRNLVLFLSSILFYAWGEPVYILLMCFTICIDYIFGLIIDRQMSLGNRTKAKISLTAAIISNLLLLGFFKYANFTINTVNSITGAGFEIIKIALPIGISFYTFQSLSYVIDVYRGDTKVQKNILDFGTYVVLFPQLIAGPIVRYRTVAEEMKGRVENRADFSKGISRFIIGLGKKVLLANNAGLLWDAVNSLTAGEMSVASFWLGILAFTFQIYFDFSGYSDMAVGMGLMLGFHFEENFNYPYMSRSITEFWRRWHISLSTWFKEYVYIPLGGNRKGIVKQIRNIIIVWLLTGFWHGASWNFVAWGLYYGFILIIEKVFLLKVLEKIPAFVRHVYTMFLVIIGWVLFSFDSFSDGANYIAGMFGGGYKLINTNFHYLLANNLILLIFLILGSTDFPKKIVEKISKIRISKVINIIVLEIILCTCIAYLVADTYNPFLYFRF